VYDKVKKRMGNGKDYNFSLSLDGSLMICEEWNDKEHRWQCRDPKEFIIMQCTGKKDNKDREIYIGDIVQFKCHQCEFIHAAVIVWIEDAACVGIHEKDQVVPLSFPIEGEHGKDSEVGILDIQEVIGNIFENSEMIAKTR
jgi:uncharacterized phage protein (TIGR01671 family)